MDVKKRKWLKLIALSIIPVAVILLCLLIYNQNKQQQVGQGQQAGNAFNTKLPEANLQDLNKNKLEVYMQAKNDSAKVQEEAKRDPYLSFSNPGPPTDTVENPVMPARTQKRNQYSPDNHPYDNERNITARIDRLNTALDVAMQSSKPERTTPAAIQATGHSEDIKKLELLLATLQSKDTASNAEMTQLASLLDQILDIQHPERITERMQQQKDTINSDPAVNRVGLTPFAITNAEVHPNNAFWGLNENVTSASNPGTIQAVIHDNQKIIAGASVKIRLLDNIFIGTMLIPKGSLVYGKSQFSDNRVKIIISQISYNNQLFPVRLNVYDQTDGMEGLNIQGDITEEVSKNGVDQLIQQMQLNSLTASLGAQAATSGLQTAKNLIGRKVKAITTNLKAGHLIFLKQEQ